jgi:hypothetical protein
MLIFKYILNRMGKRVAHPTFFRFAVGQATTLQIAEKSMKSPVYL